MSSLDERVRAWVHPRIRALHAYSVPDAQGLIKLDAMENPYGWPAELRAAWLEHLQTAALNRYPDPSARAVQACLRQVFGLEAAAPLLLGNGSDEIIQLLTLAVAGPGRCVLAPEPGFVMYRLIAQAVGAEYVGVPLRDDFELDMPAMLAAVERHRPALVFLARPNNPTGNVFTRDGVAEILRAAPGLVVVDEAYSAFTDHSMLGEAGRYDNLLVMGTLSKIGLAGLRLGFLTGPAAWLDEFEKLRLPYNINVLTQLSVEFALRHKTVLDEQARRIRADRGTLSTALARLPGLQVYPSEANFVLVRLPQGRAEEVHARLRAAGVLVKNLHPAGGVLQDCLRLTVGRREENAALLSALENALQAG